MAGTSPEITTKIEQFKRFVAQHPESAIVHYGLGNVYLKAGLAEEAAESYRAVIRLKSDYTAAHRELGRALEKLGDSEGARQAYRDGIAIGAKTGDLQTVKEMQVFLRRLDKDK